MILAQALKLISSTNIIPAESQRWCANLKCQSFWVSEIRWCKKRFVKKILRGERAGQEWRIYKAARIMTNRNHARTFLPQWPDRLGMANYRLHAPTGETTWEATAGGLPTSGKCYFLPSRQRHQMASDANQFSRLADGVWILSGIGSKWDCGRGLMLY